MSKKIVVIAGEESGDVLGGRLMNALKTKGDFEFSGIGGDSMQMQGMRTLFPMSDLSVMGVFEVIPRLALLFKRIRQTVDHIVQTQPDIVITIDSPDFCKRVVKRARIHCPNTKFIHYVAPTVWAWRSGRAKTMAELFDGLICLLPFEPPYFEKHGLKARFCGHPLIETMPSRDIEGIDHNHILILPGSRMGEVKRMAPIFAEVFKKLHALNPELEGRIVALPHIKEEVEDHFLGMNVTYIDPQTRYDAFAQAPFAMATSGTVGLELAVAGCPHIIAYKMNPLTWITVKSMVKVKFAHLVNIMEGREIIPECIQGHCNVDDIINAIKDYQEADFLEIRDKVAGESNRPPSDQAADFIIDFL